MTDLAKATDYLAKAMESMRETVGKGGMSDEEQLMVFRVIVPQLFGRIERLEKVVEAAKDMINGFVHGGTFLICDCINCKRKAETLHNAISELEPGEADGG